MAYFEKFIVGICSALYWIARVALFAAMIITCSDVFLRYVFNHPLRGGYDLVTVLGGVIISFSLPETTLKKGHVMMEALTSKLSNQGIKVFTLISGSLALMLFIIISWNLVNYGTILLQSGEVFSTLRLPAFYAAYAIGFCCLIECLVLLHRILVCMRGDTSI